MPRPKSTYLEGQMLLAIDAVKNNKIKNIHQAAKTYKVPDQTLRDRLAGRHSRAETRPASCKLTVNEEKVLEERILELSDQGFPPRLLYVREMADILLASRGGQPPKKVGTNWPENFVNRTKSLRMRWNRKKDHTRKLAEDSIAVEEWFRLVLNVKNKWGIQDEDIFNFDETGFQMGVISSSKVVTRADKSLNPDLIQPGNTDWVTVVHGINSQ